MGCGVSILVEFDPVDDVEELIVNELLKVGYTKNDIDAIYSYFIGMDKDMSSHVSMTEFMETVGVEATPFMRRVFSVMDLDESGELSFVEFACSLWNLLSVDERTLGSFVYLLIPKTGVQKYGNLVHSDQAAETIRGIFMKEDDNEALEWQLKQFMKTHTSEVNHEMLRQYLYENQSLLTPILQAQLRMRQKILGLDTWKRIIKRRMKSAELTDHEYPYKFRKKVEKATVRRDKDRSVKEASSFRASATRNFRKASILLAYMGVNLKENIVKADKDKERVKNSPKKLLSNQDKLQKNKENYEKAMKKNEATYKGMQKSSSAESLPKSRDKKSKSGKR